MLPAGILVVATVYRLRATVSDKCSGVPLKDAVQRQAWAVLCDGAVLLQFLVLVALLAGTVVRLPDFLTGLRPASRPRDPTHESAFEGRRKRVTREDAAARRYVHNSASQRQFLCSVLPPLVPLGFWRPGTAFARTGTGR